MIQVSVAFEISTNCGVLQHVPALALACLKCSCSNYKCQNCLPFDEQDKKVDHDSLKIFENQ